MKIDALWDTIELDATWITNKVQSSSKRLVRLERTQCVERLEVRVKLIASFDKRHIKSEKKKKNLYIEGHIYECF